jgi:hypothetical protein
VRGAGEGVSPWALLFLRDGQLHPGQEAKIVWRMTGTGSLTIRAEGPAGGTVTPVGGPEPHISSTWQRPGDEWGTGWVFPAAGCWTVRASRDGRATATLTLEVGG